MKIGKGHILGFAYVTLGVYMLCLDNEIVSESDFEIKKEKGVEIRRYQSTTEYYLQADDKNVYETSPLINPYLNTSNKAPFEINSIYEIGYRKVDSWKDKNNLGYTRMEIITLRKNGESILTIDNYNEAIKSNNKTGLILGIVLLLVGVILFIIVLIPVSAIKE